VSQQQTMSDAATATATTKGDGNDDGGQGKYRLCMMYCATFFSQKESAFVALAH